MSRFPSMLAVTVALLVPIALPTAAAAKGPVRDAMAPQANMGPSLHPSGNDRTVENGGSGTQGWAQHDPDGAYNYGVDQPGGAGGLYTGDQDGNNGCGNDQDFEDDNNGRCGGGRPLTECPEGTVPSSSVSAPPTGSKGKHLGHAPELTCDPIDTTDTTGKDPGDTGDTTTDTSFWSFDWL